MADIANDLGVTVAAVGALGVASYGIVDGLKLFSWIDLSGFERLFSGGKGGRAWPMPVRASLDALVPALKAAYGEETMELLKAQYRSARAKGDLPRSLRQGVRLGLDMLPREETAALLKALGIAGETVELAAAAQDKARRLRPPAAGEAVAEPFGAIIADEERAALAHVETAIDARIDAALLLAENQYVTQTRVYAMAVALGISFAVGLEMGRQWYECLLVGLAAVPLAPVAKDVASAVQEAVKAFRAR